MARELIDKASIIELINGKSKEYFNIDLNESRLGTFGLINDIHATSIDDSLKLSMNRTTGAIIELSDSLTMLRTAAAIYNVPVVPTTPSRTMANLMIEIDDIINKGNALSNGDFTFTIDKRSEIVHNEVYFSLPDSIVIKAVKDAKGNYFYTAEWVEIDPIINPMTSQKIVIDGNEKIQISTMVYQYKINSIQKDVIDSIAFNSEGLLFDYDDHLVGFDVYYKRSNGSKFIKANMVYHILEITDDNSLRYKNDRDGELYIMNSYKLDLPVNSIIRVDLKESIGLDGMIGLGNTQSEFHIFQDEDYGLLSVHIEVQLLFDPIGATAADGADAIRAKLISRKFMRNSLITEFDLRNYINSQFSNTQVVERENDFKTTEYSIYTLLDIGDSKSKVIVPTNTMDLRIVETEFDFRHDVTKRYILKSNAAFSTVNEKLAKKLPTIPVGDALTTMENDRNKLCLAFPFVMTVTNEPICKFFMNTIQETFIPQNKYINENSALKFNIVNINFERNSMSTAYDTYKIDMSVIPNSINDSQILIEDPNDPTKKIIDHTKLKLFMIFKSNKQKVAYLPLVIDSVDEVKNLIKVSSTFKTDDYITEDLSLKITGGLIPSGKTIPEDIVIDYLKSEFEVVVFNKEIPPSSTGEYYTMIPNMSGYTITNIVYNNEKKLDLLIDLNTFINSSVKITQETIDTKLTNVYTFKEIPFIKYSYCRDNIFKILEKIKLMKTLYEDLGKRLVGKNLNLKFIRTYGKSQYIKIGTNKANLANINPSLIFKLYGEINNISEIKSFILSYFDTVNDIDKGVIYLSNICREIETIYGVPSAIATQIDDFTEVNPILYYDKPSRESSPEMYASYIPEYLCIANIQIIISNT